MEDAGWDKSRSRCVHMTVAPAALGMREEALRDDQPQVVLRARHGDIKEAALFLDFCGAACGEIGGQAAIDGVQNKDRLPFLSLRRMNGRKDQIVFIEQSDQLAGRSAWVRCASVTGNNQRSQGIPGGATTRLMRCSKLQPSAVLFFFKLRGRLAAKSCRLQWLSTLRRRASAPRRTVRTTSCACWEAGAEPA